MSVTQTPQKLAKFFGTDGVRGLANAGKMTPDSILVLGQAAGAYCNASREETDGKPSVLIGRDTRASGDMVEAALVSGLTSMGVDVVLCDPIPTPAVSLLTQSLMADMGFMITASHNKYPDNGIKLFGADGYKITDEVQAHIESSMRERDFSLTPSEQIGRVRKITDAPSRYVKIARSYFPRNLRLSGLKIVLDCANGAGFQAGPMTLKALGVKDLVEIGVSPNGQNINKDCGSTHTDLLSKTVIAESADIGIALDGDADRLIMCDEKGQVIDGDQLLGVLAEAWQRSGQLSKLGIVATVMSNLGLERFIKSKNMTFVRTAVGDRQVATSMRAEGYNIGGEQSGHILMTDFVPTGDGIIAALQIVAEILRQDRPASEVLNVFDPVPQLLKNVRFTGASPLDRADVQAAIREADAQFAGEGRVLVRASGTEPLIRVMAEGDDAALVEKIVDNLVAVINNSAS